jgi:hypothetical protein
MLALHEPSPPRLNRSAPGASLGRASHRSALARAPFARTLLALGLLVWSGESRAQTCPETYTACDNGACCLGSEQCCPNAAEGCCPSYAPFCCGDGSCAAALAQCGGAGQPVCDDYQVPCGEGCAPAGSDCCDAAGHYCEPETRCASPTSCLRGDAPANVFLTVPVASGTGSAAQPRSPLSDPPRASDRSCALAPGARPPARRSARQALEWGWPVAFSALLLRARRRRPAGMLSR